MLYSGSRRPQVLVKGDLNRTFHGERRGAGPIEGRDRCPFRSPMVLLSYAKSG